MGGEGGEKCNDGIEVELVVEEEVVVGGVANRLVYLMDRKRGGGGRRWRNVYVMMGLSGVGKVKVGGV